MKLVEGGAHVEKGDPILKFSNTDYSARRSIPKRSFCTTDIQRSSEVERRKGLILRENLLDLEHQIPDAEAKLKRYDQLIEAGNSAISQKPATFRRIRRVPETAEPEGALRRHDEPSSQLLGQVAFHRSPQREPRPAAKIVKSSYAGADLGYLSTIDAEVGQNVPAGSALASRSAR
jgi:biotin carboxyl carrier protein